MSVQVQVPKLDAPIFQEHGERTRILFVYDKLDDKRRNLCGAIREENRYDVTECHIDDAKTAFSDHDLLITDRATLMPDPLRPSRRIYKGDELIRHLKSGGRNPGLVVLVASDIEDPGILYDGRPPLQEPDMYYQENIMRHVCDYFRYPFDVELFLKRLERLDTNRY